MEKLVITVAPTGSVPRKKDTPHVPVTPEEIQEVAKKHLDPDNLILAAAGAVSAEGKLLEKAPTPNQ